MSDYKRPSLTFTSRSGGFALLEQWLSRGERSKDYEWVYSWLLVIGLAGVIFLHTSNFF